MKIRKAAKRLSESLILQRKNIKAKIAQLVKDKKSIQRLETRRQNYLQEILLYIQENLTGIYRLDNEPVTYNQLKYKYLKKLFPIESSAITFHKKYVRLHHWRFRSKLFYQGEYVTDRNIHHCHFTLPIFLPLSIKLFSSAAA